MKTIKVIDAQANNLKNISVDIEFGKLTVCAGPSAFKRHRTGLFKVKPKFIFSVWRRMSKN